MKKTTIGIIIALVLFLMVFLLYLFVSQSRTNTITPNQIVSVTPALSVTYPPVNQFKINQVSPQNDSTNVPIDAKITISFDKNVHDGDVSFSLGSAVPFSLQVQNNTVVVTFNQPLSPGTFYTYTIKYPQSNNFPDTFSFTTTGPTQRFLPNTYPGYVE